MLTGLCVWILPKFRQNPNVERAQLNPKQILGLELTVPVDQAGNRESSMGSGWEDCACSQGRIPGKGTQIGKGLWHLPASCPPCFTEPRPLTLGVCLQALQLLHSPSTELLFPELLSQIYSSPRPPSIFFVPNCASKPPVCHRPELLSVSVPHPPSLPGSLLSGSVPTIASLHSQWLHPYPLHTSGHKPCWGPALLLFLIIDYWFCGFCCPSPKLWHPLSIHCHLLTSQPSQPNPCMPRTLQESCSDFCFWQTFSKSEHRLHLPKICLAQLWRN